MYLGMLLITPVNASCSPPRPGGEGTAGGGEVGWGGGGGVAAARYQPPVLACRCSQEATSQERANEQVVGDVFF